jgi:hypothetical protein
MLHDMGFITSEILFYICGGLALFLVILLIWNIRLEIRMRRLTRGKDGKSLEGSFANMNKDISDIQNFRKELEHYLTLVEKRLKRSIQGVTNLNFNAFSGAESGAKSFATAFVNENGDGIIISSLNARDRLSIFTKEIHDWKTTLELSEEESTALTNAKESCKV